MKRLENKVIIVTGGSGLIGKKIVEQIKNEGGICINADINVQTDSDLQNLYCDISDENSIQNVITLVLNKFGKIDGLVNNAYPHTKDWGKKFEDISTESWKKNVDMQMNSLFSFCQQTLKVMKEQQFGRIVNIASIYGIVGPDFSIYEGTDMTMPAAYSAIKGGIINFTRYLASYYGPFGININSVSPGGIFDNQNPVFVKNYEQKVPLKRMGNPSDIAGPVVFLLSDNAAYVTGHNLIVDGGWTII